MTLIAKPIVKGQLWVITNGTQKLGNIEADTSGYNVKIGDNTSHFTSTKHIERMIQIEFERPGTKAKKTDIPYAQWPTTGKTYNNVYDVRKKLHLFTKSNKSKCLHVAGWFKIKLNGEWQVQLCPKYIFIQRYPYHGPYNTEHEASSV